MRGLLTASALYTWRGDKLHIVFQRETGLEGVRLRLRPDTLQVNEETIAFPEHFPWIFGEIADIDMLDRRRLVEDWLKRNPRIIDLYPGRFKVEWYS